jgi:molybdopterin converting factor small subunit
MSTLRRLDDSAEQVTTVDVKATGHVRTALDEHRFDFTFEGDTLREFLAAFFDEYGLEEMLIAETDAEAATDGWASAAVPEDVPGDWHRNDEGENTRPYARVLVNGRFNEGLDGFDTELSDGDRVALVYPFVYCV